MTQPGGTTDLAVAPDKRVRPAGAAGGGSMDPGLCKRIMGVLRAVYHMLRRGLCRKRLMMDLHLLLGRGKLAGRALRNLVAAAHYHPHGAAHHLVAARARARAGLAASPASSPSFQDAAAAPGLSFAHDPRDVEFSCAATPSPSAAAFSRPGRALFPFRIGGHRGGGGGGGRGCDGLDFAEVARALERLHADDEAAGASSSSGSGNGAEGAETPLVAGATPSPLLALSLGRSPAGARRLRVTDSPFPVEPEGLDERVDSRFDAFISRFYESLRLQQADATPDNCARRRG